MCAVKRTSLWSGEDGGQGQERLWEGSGQLPELLDPGGHAAAVLDWMVACT